MVVRRLSPCFNWLPGGKWSMSSSAAATSPTRGSWRSWAESRASGSCRRTFGTKPTKIILCRLDLGRPFRSRISCADDPACPAHARKPRLDVGVGSGYQAAILAELCQQVYGIEILEPLANDARELLAALGYKNIEIRAAMLMPAGRIARGRCHSLRRGPGPRPPIASSISLPPAAGW